MSAGISSYTLGTCLSSNAYFYRLARRFRAEKAQILGLVQDLERSPFQLRGREMARGQVDLGRLGQKFRVREG